MIQTINLEGLIGKRVALHNGEDWDDYRYEIVGYALDLEEGRQYVVLYLLKYGGNGLPITRSFKMLKLKLSPISPLIFRAKPKKRVKFLNFFA